MKQLSQYWSIKYEQENKASVLCCMINVFDLSIHFKIYLSNKSIPISNLIIYKLSRNLIWVLVKFVKNINHSSIRWWRLNLGPRVTKLMLCQANENKKTRKSSCRKPHEAYLQQHNLSWGVPQSWPGGALVLASFGCGRKKCKIQMTSVRFELTASDHQSTIIVITQKPSVKQIKNMQCKNRSIINTQWERKDAQLSAVYVGMFALILSSTWCSL